MYRLGDIDTDNLSGLGATAAESIIGAVAGALPDKVGGIVNKAIAVRDEARAIRAASRPAAPVAAPSAPSIVTQPQARGFQVSMPLLIGGVGLLAVALLMKGRGARRNPGRRRRRSRRR